MPDRFELRPATPEDTDRILELMSLSLGEGQVPRDVDYWNWKHQRNPFGPSPCLLAVVGEDIVGLRVFMRWQWSAGATTCSAVRAVDTATHPAWRRRGIFSGLTTALIGQVKSEGVSFVFNTPNRRSLPGYLKMGWRRVGRVSVWLRPMRPLALASAGLDAMRRTGSTGRRNWQPSVGFPVEEMIEDRALTAFLEALSTPVDSFSTPRTRDYLRWRYADIPGLKYRAIWKFEGRSGAVAVFRANQGYGLRELRLCELLVGSESMCKEMAKDLLSSLISESDADFASAMQPTGTSALGVLAFAGFVPAPRSGPVMTVRPLNVAANGLNPLRRSDWRLSIGDLELF